MINEEQKGLSFTAVIIIIALMVFFGGGFLYIRTMKIMEEEKSNTAITNTIIFGNEANKRCGPQPPLICVYGTVLGCRVADKKWGCYPYVNVVNTSDWKTYRRNGDFEFKYPQDYEVALESTRVKGIFFVSFWLKNLPQSEQYQHDANGEEFLTVWIDLDNFDEAAQKMGFEKENNAWVIRGRQGMSGAAKEITVNGNKGLQGIKATEFFYKDGNRYAGLGAELGAFLTNGDSINPVSVFFNMSPMISKEVFDGVVSTFRFIELEKTASAGTSPVGVPFGYNARRIEVKYQTGTNVSDPLILLPKDLQSGVEQIIRLAPAGGDNFRWLQIDLKPSVDGSVFMRQLTTLPWVENAEFAPLATKPPR